MPLRSAPSGSLQGTASHTCKDCGQPFIRAQELTRHQVSRCPARHDPLPQLPREAGSSFRAAFVPLAGRPQQDMSSF
jgi:hypothetical protein